MVLERGFKSWAERTSINLRTDLGLRPFEPLLPAQLASYLEVHLCTPLDIPGIPQNVLDQLPKHDPSGWSGVSIQRFGRALVIYNPEHSSGRQSNDIMHELAHLILDHKPTDHRNPFSGRVARDAQFQPAARGGSGLACRVLAVAQGCSRAFREGWTHRTTNCRQVWC